MWIIILSPDSVESDPLELHLKPSLGDIDVGEFYWENRHVGWFGEQIVESKEYFSAPVLVDRCAFRQVVLCLFREEIFQRDSLDDLGEVVMVGGLEGSVRVPIVIGEVLREGELSQSIEAVKDLLDLLVVAVGSGLGKGYFEILVTSTGR